MTNKDTISAVLNLAPIEPEKKDIVTVDDGNDYEFARDNIKKLIETGFTALNELSEIAFQAQHPRVYEVLSNHLKAMIDAQKDLLNLKKISNELGDTTNNTQDNSLKINNSILVGSTSELQKMLKDLAAKKPIEEVKEEDVKDE